MQNIFAQWSARYRSPRVEVTATAQTSTSQFAKLVFLARQNCTKVLCRFVAEGSSDFHFDCALFAKMAQSLFFSLPLFVFPRRAPTVTSEKKKCMSPSRHSATTPWLSGTSSPIEMGRLSSGPVFSPRCRHPKSNSACQPYVVSVPKVVTEELHEAGPVSLACKRS